jgi:hypothetical protein
MEHSTSAVSLTYLRGLEVSELKESDMPMVYGFLYNPIKASIKKNIAGIVTSFALFISP